MTNAQYVDFDVLIESSRNGYRVRVLNSPAGQAIHDFALPFSPLELENYLLKLGQPRKGVRGGGSPQADVAREFGGRLFKAVFDDAVLSVFRGSLDEAIDKEAGLRIRLRLDSPELANLPWEYLYNPSLNRFLSLSPETPVVRYLDLPERIRPLTVKPPLRILVMIASPKDYEALDAAREWENLNQATLEQQRRGRVVLERLQPASLGALLKQLKQAEYNVFHFIGHGSFNEQTQDGTLVFEEETGYGRSVSGSQVATILQPHRSLRLAVLNACEGARTSGNDPFAGVAQSLVQQGIPAVVAMQFEVTDDAAITFAHELYTAVTNGVPVDAALADARLQLFARQENMVEWGTPVLYMRSPDGLIFDLQAEGGATDPSGLLAPAALLASAGELTGKSIPLSRPTTRIGREAGLEISLADTRLSRRHAQILRAGSQYTFEDLGSTNGSFINEQRVIQPYILHHGDVIKLGSQAFTFQQPNQPPAREAGALITDQHQPVAPPPAVPAASLHQPAAPQEDLSAARRQRVAGLLDEARAAEAAKDWQAAALRYQAVLGLEPDHAEARARLAEVQRLLQAGRVAALYREAQNAVVAGQWEAAARSLQAILALDPAQGEAQAMLTQAQQMLQERNLAAFYEQALGHQRAGRRRLALDCLLQIQKARPGYRDTEALIQTLRSELGEKKAPGPAGTPAGSPAGSAAEVPPAPAAEEAGREYSLPLGNPDELAGLARQYFIQKDYEAQIVRQEQKWIVQGRKGGWRSLVGMGLAASLVIEPTTAGVKVSIGGGKWLEQGAAIAVSMFVLWPLLLTGGAGMLMQKSLIDELWKQVEAYVTARGGVRLS